MTFTTFNRFRWVARVIPVTLAPIIVLILQLYPADAVDLLIDELFVAGGTVIRSFEEAFTKALDMMTWITTNQEMVEKLRRFSATQSKHIPLGLCDYIISVSFEIGFADGMTNKTGNSLLITAQRCQVLGENILRS